MAVCAKLDAEAGGLLVQRDTYFEVPSGRLKLREESGATPHLISYQRSDEPGQRKSHYRIVEVERAEEMLAVLGGSLEVKVEALRGEFGLADVDLVAGSYCDLILASR